MQSAPDRRKVRNDAQRVRLDRDHEASHDLALLVRHLNHFSDRGDTNWESLTHGRQEGVGPLLIERKSLGDRSKQKWPNLQ